MSTTNTNTDLSDLHLRSATEVVELLRTQQVTPLQLIDVVEQRLRQINPLVNCAPQKLWCFDLARRNANEFVLPSNPPTGYLYGLPMLIKDDRAVKGVKFVKGSLLFKDRIADDDDALVVQLQKMGAIVVAKTNVPEFCAGSHTFNEVFPTTTSPYNIRTSAGGSSGGSASALASCCCWLATGSDLGGSLRIPAAFCGVVGFRTTPGQVVYADRNQEQEIRDASAQSRFLHVINGPMARSVSDVALMMDALTHDSRNAQGKVHGWTNPWDPSPPSLEAFSWQTCAKKGQEVPVAFRVCYSTLGCEVNDTVDTLCQRVAKLLSGDNGSFTEIARPFDLEASERCFFMSRAAMFGATYAEFSKEERAQLKPEIQWNHACYDAAIANLHLAQVVRDSQRLEVETDDLFKRFDVLAVPCTMDAAFDAGLRYPTKSYGSMEDGDEFDNYLEWMMTACHISATSCPVISVPVGTTADGRPIGLQLVGRWGDDAKVLTVAAALEYALTTPQGLLVPHARCLKKGCAQPMKGSQKMYGNGPRTIQEARLHHAEAKKKYLEKIPKFESKN